MSVQRPSRIVWWLRATIVVGTLLIATGVGGMVFEARRKVAAIDCLSGASPPSIWEYDRHGPEAVRSLVGERGAMMFLDQPRTLDIFDVLTADQCRAIQDLPSLREVHIAYTDAEHLAQFRGLTQLERLTICSDVPPQQVAELQASLPDCDIIYWHWDGSRHIEFRFPGQ